MALRRVGPRRFLALTVSFSAGLAALLTEGAAARERELPRPLLHFVGSRNRRFETTVTRAVATASQRLAGERCAGILSDFRDPSGRLLRERLEETGLDPRAYLESLLFLDGDLVPFCQPSFRLAGTQPGGRFILLCGGRFARLQFQDPALAAVLVLHEALHTLGLAENPPSSAEITRTVWVRCAN